IDTQRKGMWLKLLAGPHRHGREFDHLLCHDFERMALDDIAQASPASGILIGDRAGAIARKTCYAARKSRQNGEAVEMALDIGQHLLLPAPPGRDIRQEKIGAE